ncbi:MAG: hypothetical protein KDD77_15705 [Caldilineaceae bacterium]|nr:hypothetical protein [Caldilineaceae bacterium]
MGTVHDILARKGSQVFTVPAGASVLDAARVMNEHKIGALLVELDGRTVEVFAGRGRHAGLELGGALEEIL